MAETETRDRVQNPSGNWPRSYEEARLSNLTSLRKRFDALLDEERQRHVDATDIGFGMTSTPEQADWRNQSSESLVDSLQATLNQAFDALRLHIDEDEIHAHED